MVVFLEFFNIGVLLEILVFAITIAITLMSYRMYRRFEKPKYRQFSTGFLFISLGYLCSAIISISAYNQPFVISHLNSQLFIDIFSQLWYLCVLLGLLLLVYLYYDIHDLSLKFLIASLVITAFIIGGASDFIFVILSGIMFLFIAIKLYRHYRSFPDKNALFILFGFSLLVISKLFSGILLVHEGFYAGYYLFKLAGVALIAYSLWVISR